jgi:transcriptional regulator with XRE-family HTH domain
MTTSDLVVLGAAIRALRMRAGLSQRDLAERAGLGEPYLSRIEGGHRDIRWSMLVRLLDGMDGSLADLERVIAKVETTGQK